MQGKFGRKLRKSALSGFVAFDNLCEHTKFSSFFSFSERFGNSASLNMFNEAEKALFGARGESADSKFPQARTRLMSENKKGCPKIKKGREFCMFAQTFKAKILHLIEHLFGILLQVWVDIFKPQFNFSPLV